MGANGFYLDLKGRFDYAGLLDWTTRLSNAGISVFFESDRAYFRSLKEARTAADLSLFVFANFVRPNC